MLEQADELEPLGAGITLWPNAVRALAVLGVPLPSPAGSGMGGVRRRDGRWLSRTRPASYPARYGAPLIALHRAQLQRALLSCLPAGTVATGVRVAGVEQGDGVVVEHSRGTAGAELAVLADGLDSSTRHLVCGPGPRPRFAGYTAWRGVARLAAGDAEVAAATESWGRGERFGIVPLADGGVYWFATANAREGERGADGERAEVLARFDGWRAPIPRLIRATEPATVVRHDIYDLRPDPDTYFRGRLVLLGDAAHAMTPNLGQGACQAIEDAVVLGAVACPGVPLAAALARYGTLRRPRTR